MEAVVLLLNRFGWNWIATLGSDDEYGRGAQGLFLSIAANHSICIAFEGLIPTDLADPKAQHQLEDTIKLINNTKVNIIVLFAFSQPAQALLEQSIRMGLSEKVWIGTEAWIMSDKIATTPNIQSIGTVLGFIMKAHSVPGFQKYVADLFTYVQQDKFCQESREFNHLMNSDVVDTLCKECDHISLRNISSVLRHSQMQPVYIAVYSVAHALHRALGCTHHVCPKASIKSWQVSKGQGDKQQFFIRSTCRSCTQPGREGGTLHCAPALPWERYSLSNSFGHSTPTPAPPLLPAGAAFSSLGLIGPGTREQLVIQPKGR